MFYSSLLNISDEEKQAQDLVKEGHIEQAIIIYQEIKPESARVLHIIGTLYVGKIGDYDLAISCFERALQLKKEVDIHKAKHDKLIGNFISL